MSDSDDCRALAEEIAYKDAIIDELEDQNESLSEKLEQMELVVEDLDWLLWNQVVVRYEAMLAHKHETCDVLRQAMLANGSREIHVPKCGFCWNYDTDCSKCPFGQELGQCGKHEDSAWSRAHRLLFSEEAREAWVGVVNEILDVARTHVL